MNKEIFRILKEFHGLTQKKLKLGLEIKDELSRIDKIEEQRKKRSSDKQKNESLLKERRAELTKVENSIADYSKKLEGSKANVNNVFSENEIKALEEQIKTFSESLDMYEEQGLELLEEIETFEEEIKAADSFLNGTLETIKEIEEDIKIDNEPLYIELKTINQRLELLPSEIPEKLFKKVIQLQEKGPKFSPISFLTSQNTCSECGYLPPKTLVDNVEIRLKIHSCPGCERIFIPESSKYL